VKRQSKQVWLWQFPSIACFVTSVDLDANFPILVFRFTAFTSQSAPMTAPTLLSITSDLYESLTLLVDDARIQLPEELQRVIVKSLEHYLPESQDEQGHRTEPGSDVGQEEPTGGEEKPAGGSSSDASLAENKEQPSTESKAYVPHSVLLSVSQWTRLPKSSRTLHRLGIGERQADAEGVILTSAVIADPNRYSMIALCAGTRTYTTRAQERLIKTDPTAVRTPIAPIIVFH
jgi:hypothetical protein